MRGSNSSAGSGVWQWSPTCMPVSGAIAVHPTPLPEQRARRSLGLGGHHTTPPLTACHWLSAGWSQGVSSLSRLTATLPVVHSSVTAVGWPRDHLYVSCGQSFVQVSLPLAGLMSGLMSSEPEMYSEVPYCRHCMHPCMGLVESEESTMGRCRHRRRSRKVHPDF